MKHEFARLKSKKANRRRNAVVKCVTTMTLLKNSSRIKPKSKERNSKSPSSLISWKNSKSVMKRTARSLSLKVKTKQRLKYNHFLLIHFLLLPLKHDSIPLKGSWNNIITYMIITIDFYRKLSKKFKRITIRFSVTPRNTRSNCQLSKINWANWLRRKKIKMIRCVKWRTEWIMRTRNSSRTRRISRRNCFRLRRLNSTLSSVVTTCRTDWILFLPMSQRSKRITNARTKKSNVVSKSSPNTRKSLKRSHKLSKRFKERSKRKTKDADKRKA